MSNCTTDNLENRKYNLRLPKSQVLVGFFGTHFELGDLAIFKWLHLCSSVGGTILRKT